MLRELYQTQISGYDAQGTWFLPESPPIATMVLLHGQGDFIERYEEFMSIFCAAGVAVCGFDFPGHGHTSGKRGDIPSLAVVDSFLEALGAEIETRFPSIPRGIIGHSMGGHLALRELLTNQSQYTFSWISSPLINPRKNKPSWEVFILEYLAKIIPEFTVSTGLRRSSSRRLKNNTAKSNPLFHKKISLRWGVALFESSEKLRLLATETCLKTNILITQGNEDKVTPLPYLESFLKEVNWPSTELVIIKGARHEPFRDITQEKCLNTVSQWLKKIKL